VIINVTQSRVPIVFARSVPQTAPTVTRTPANLSLASLKDVTVSVDVQSGDGIFYDSVLKKWVSQAANTAIKLDIIDGGTY
jgi:hypothetical protein